MPPEQHRENFIQLLLFFRHGDPLRYDGPLRGVWVKLVIRDLYLNNGYRELAGKPGHRNLNDIIDNENEGLSELAQIDVSLLFRYNNKATYWETKDAGTVQKD